MLPVGPNNMRLHFLVYISTRYNLGEKSDLDDLKAIYETSKGNNARCCVTGALVVTPNRFIQWLEGDRNCVINTYERIASDRRHHHVTVRMSGPLEKRVYANWSMNSVQIDSVEKMLYGFDHLAHDIDPYDMTNDALINLLNKATTNETSVDGIGGGPATAFVDPDIVYLD